ncbi:MAG: DUF2007 domain-containing protein [Chloroflexi bacterium]|nr:DUF2007 domain-containing protein [Chloroflexota bacterium]MBI5712505.1 DUF2007 domain-containing protein [Chloroflexota bacterium]
MNNLISIYVAHGQVEAQLIKSLLEAEGIPVMIAQEGAGAAYGLTVGILGIAEIFVREKDAEEAKRLIEEMKRDEDEGTINGESES